MRIKIQPLLLAFGIASTINLYIPSATAQSTTSDYQAKRKDGSANATTNVDSTVPVTNAAAKTYIITLRREADQGGCAKDHKLTRKMQFHHALNGFVADLDDSTVRQLKQDKRVLAVEADGKIYTDGQVISTGISRMGIDHFPVAKIDEIDERINVDVAVIDSGIQTNHPDLNVLNGFEQQYNVTPDYGSSWNADDNDGHGTHVAGIIGALDNNIGVVGVAPGVRLWAIKVLSANGTGYFSWAVGGLDFVAQHADQISIVNMSLGGNASYVSLQTAIQGVVNKGVVVVAAAGNSTNDIAGIDGIFGTADDVIPASYPEVMAVSAMDPASDTIARFSNFSQVARSINYVVSSGGAIDVAAPGVNILSTYTNSSYAVLSGTSMAAPHVTGLVALYIAANGRATNAAGVFKIRQAIIDAGLPQSQWNATNTLDPDSNPEPLAVASMNWIPTPKIIPLNQSNGMMLDFNAVPNYNYVAQYCDSLSGTQWTNLSGSTMGSDDFALEALNDNNPNASSRFYRLVVSPAPLALIVTNSGSGGETQNAYTSGALTNETGIVGNSFKFSNPNLLTNKTGSFIDVPISSVLNPNGPFTVEFWIKPAQLVNGVFCPLASLENFNYHGYVLYNGWAFYLTSSNQWQFSVGTESFNMINAAGGTAISNVWQYIAGVYDGTYISLYVNGNLVAGPIAVVQNLQFPAPYQPNLSRPLRFGAASDGTRTFDGWLDEPAIYTNALSATQISAHFNAATTNNSGYATQILGDGPVGYWHFDD